MLRSSSFNSLQTGKRIQSDRVSDDNGDLVIVSIPFKRESGSKVQSERDERVLTMLIVSIPFKRESGSKADVAIAQYVTAVAFQFPSNGKADPKSKAQHLSVH